MSYYIFNENFYTSSETYITEQNIWIQVGDDRK